MLLLSFVIILQSLCSPNEDFGRLNKTLRVRFWSTFQGCEYSFWATTDWKLVQKSYATICSTLENSSFGSHKVVTKDRNIPENPTHRISHHMLLSFVIILQSLWLPNDDFGMLNETLDDSFRSTFQRFVAQIRYSHPWKVLRRNSSRC